LKAAWDGWWRNSGHILAKALCKGCARVRAYEKIAFRHGQTPARPSRGLIEMLGFFLDGPVKPGHDKGEFSPSFYFFTRARAGMTPRNSEHRRIWGHRYPPLLTPAAG
jgi:hypothetical protein